MIAGMTSAMLVRKYKFNDFSNHCQDVTITRAKGQVRDEWIAAQFEIIE